LDLMVFVQRKVTFELPGLRIPSPYGSVCDCRLYGRFEAVAIREAASGDEHPFANLRTAAEFPREKMGENTAGVSETR